VCHKATGDSLYHSGGGVRGGGGGPGKGADKVNDDRAKRDEVEIKLKSERAVLGRIISSLKLVKKSPEAKRIDDQYLNEIDRSIAIFSKHLEKVEKHLGRL